MRVVIARTMPEFSMDVYAEGLISGLRSVRPDWEVVELSPAPLDRKSGSLLIRIKKYYERFWQFPHTVLREEADIVHIVDSAEAHIVYGLRKTSKRTVVTCHDLINYFYADNRIASVQLPFVSHAMWLRAIRGMRFAHHVVAVSGATAKDAVHILNLDPARVSVVPNAVEPAFQTLAPDQVQAIRQRYGLRSDTLCLLNVGSNHRRKNLLNILKSLGMLRERGLAFEFWKVGSDFTDEQAALIYSQGLEGVVRYLGKPERSTLMELYNAADLLIFPSLFEGFGIPLLEAMSCGTPVITANTSSMPEVVGDAGILVDPHSSEAIANAVLQLHSDPLLYAQLKENGIIRARSFTWQKTAEQIATIYETLLQS